MLEPSRMIFGTLVLLGLGMYFSAIRDFLVLVGILHYLGTLVEVGILV